MIDYPIPRPSPPPTPSYEIIDETIPKEDHEWGEPWDDDHHDGYICTKCGDTSDCAHCNPKGWRDEGGCAKQQAKCRNSGLYFEYMRQSKKYAIELQYWIENVKAYFDSLGNQQ